MTLTANFSPAASFDNYSILVRTGGLDGTYSGYGSRFRALLFDESGTLLWSIFHDVSLSAGLYLRQNRDWVDRMSTFSVELDYFNAPFQISDVRFTPWVDSLNQWDYANQIIVDAEDMIAPAAVPLPGALPLLLSAIVGGGLLARRRSGGGKWRERRSLGSGPDRAGAGPALHPA